MISIVGKGSRVVVVVVVFSFDILGFVFLLVCSWE